MDVHRRLYRGVPNQFLLHLHRRSGLVQPRTIRVAERVPANAGELTGGSLALLMNEQPLAVRSWLSSPVFALAGGGVAGAAIG